MTEVVSFYWFMGFIIMVSVLCIAANKGKYD